MFLKNSVSKEPLEGVCSWAGAPGRQLGPPNNRDPINRTRCLEARSSRPPPGDCSESQTPAPEAAFLCVHSGPLPAFLATLCPKRRTCRRPELTRQSDSSSSALAATAVGGGGHGEEAGVRGRQASSGERRGHAHDPLNKMWTSARGQHPHPLQEERTEAERTPALRASGTHGAAPRGLCACVPPVAPPGPLTTRPRSHRPAPTHAGRALGTPEARAFQGPQHACHSLGHAERALA